VCSNNDAEHNDTSVLVVYRIIEPFASLQSDTEAGKQKR
jgi:hypothetical protein